MPIVPLISLFLLLGGCNFVSPNPSAQNSEVQNITLEQLESYQDYATLLNTYVNDQGLVNYQDLQAHRGGLDSFNSSLDLVSPNTYQNWTEAEQIAFWLNAYNAFTLQSIIDQNPLKSSIRDIPGVWKIRKFPILEKAKTLDNIEHSILRVNFNEPRLHMALVCAAISCPPLRQQPYTGEDLDQQLDDQTRRFLNSLHGLQIDQDNNLVYLSSIFKWFGKDWLNNYQVNDDSFTGSKEERAVLNFISGYFEPETQQYLRTGNYQIRYLEYDWSLNIDTN